MGNKWTTLSILYIMKLEHNITLGKILCVYIDQDPNIIYSYANYSMPFELMTLSVNYEPKLRNLFSVTPPFIRTLSHASAEQPIHSITHPFRNVHHTMKSCSPPPTDVPPNACKPSSQDSCSRPAWAIWVWGYLAYTGTVNLKNPKRNQWQGI